MNSNDQLVTSPLRERHKAMLYLVITAVLWSTGGMLIKMVSWNSIAISGARSGIAALMILAVIKRPRMKFSFSLLGGSIMYASTVILFVAATKLTTAANAILLQYTAPIYIAVFGVWLLKERASTVDWITVFFVLGGMVLFFFDDLKPGGLLGNLLAILSGVSFAFTIMLLRKLRSESPLESVFWGNVITFLVSLPFMTGKIPDLKSIAGLFLLGIFQLGLAYIFYSKAIKHITALEAVLIQTIEPLLNPIWVMLALGEMPGIWSLVGGLIVLTAIVLRSVILSVKVKKLGI